MPNYETLSPVVSSDFPSEWYDLSGAEHFWIQWRLRAFLRLLDDLGVPRGIAWTGLDIGCAHGVLTRQIESASQWIVDGCDVTRDSLARNTPGRGRVLLYDVNDRRPELKDRYAFLILFDVLEHIESVGSFLASSLHHLRPGGFVFVNVPALMSLYSRYDREVGHYRRYDVVSLSRDLESAGLCLDAMRYWGLCLVPLLWVRKAAVARAANTQNVVRRGFEPPLGIVNTALKALMIGETTLVRRPPAGTSLLAVAHKPV